MGPIQSINVCIAPAFYACQIDIFGLFKSYFLANNCATIKMWFLNVCCCTTGAIDNRTMEDYSSDSVIMAFIRFSCHYGDPKYDIKHRLFNEYGVDFRTCLVGAHYIHGKVECKIKEVKKSVQINVQNERLSLIQWETLMHQISNSINNLPSGLKNRTLELESRFNYT